VSEVQFNRATREGSCTPAPALGRDSGEVRGGTPDAVWLDGARRGARGKRHRPAGAVLRAAGYDGYFALKCYLEALLGAPVDLVMEGALRPWARPQVEQEAIDVAYWRGIAGFRDVLAHAYFALDEDTLWDIITRKVPELIPILEAALAESS
jgi:hypothetical protein